MLKLHHRGFLYYANVGTCIPPSDADSPARAAFLELLLHDPAGARRERLQARVAYWRRRLQGLHDRAAALRALVREDELEAGTPAMDRWNGRVELAVAEADEMEAALRLADVEAAAREAGAELEPFVLKDAPLPEPLPVEAEPKRRGPKIGCECGACSRCRAREAMRARRAAAKAAVARGWR